jgi:hypothetical protein
MYRRSGNEKYLKDAREAYEKLPRANHGIYLSRRYREEAALRELERLKQNYEEALPRIIRKYGENTNKEQILHF